MKNYQKRESYLLTFNINIYAETKDGDSIFDHDGRSVIIYPKGHTVEVSKEAFVSLCKHDGLSVMTEIPFTGESCHARYSASDIGYVAVKEETIIIQMFGTEMERGKGLTEGLREKVVRDYRWEKNPNVEIGCSLEQDIEFATESENFEWEAIKLV